MTQFKKDEVRLAILKSARREFSLYGFQGANLRDIAKRAEQKPANIYNYFKNKDDLFRGVVAETLEAIETGIKFIKNWHPSDSQPVYSLEEERQTLLTIVDYIDKNREDVYLIAFKAQGSSLAYLKEELITETKRVFTGAISEVVRYSAGKYSYTPSEFFFSSVNRYFLDSMLEMLRQEMKYDEMLAYIDEMLIFYYNGIMALMSRKS